MKAQLSITLDEDIDEKLRARADDEGRSVSNMVQLLLKQVLDKKVAKRAPKFVKPDFDDIANYMRFYVMSNPNNIALSLYNQSAHEAQKFIDYYNSNGWKVGKNPMKDWKASVRNWLKNVQQRQTPTNSRNTRQTALETAQQDAKDLYSPN